MTRLSPMMEQYKTIKAQHPDKLLMFQVGDFYELFYEDAELAARELEITLTARDGGSENPVPLAGVPIHAAETYLNRLLAKGFKVVICDQVESASQAKGLVRRAITRILTPGTITDPEMLDEGDNNYLMALIGEPGGSFGLAAVDISTGDFQITENEGSFAAEILLDEIMRLRPAEIICNSEALEAYLSKKLKLNYRPLIENAAAHLSFEEAKEAFIYTWDKTVYDELILDRYPLALKAGAAALNYLDILQQLPSESNLFRKPELYFSNKFMIIDNITCRNLELTQSLPESGKKGSLLYLLDYCATGMGKRLLRRWLEQPLLDEKLIEERHLALEELVRKPLLRKELRNALNRIFDLERFCSRLNYQRINARDLVGLKNSLKMISPLKEQLGKLDCKLLKEINQSIPSFEEIITRLEDSLVEDPPQTLKEGNLFKKGYHEEIDRLRSLSHDSSKMLLDYEQRERQQTGIKTLKVGYNRNFGYYIEVTKTNLHSVPAAYHRRQTLVNAERYITEELQQLEEQITGAKEKLAQLEYALFEELRDFILTESEVLLQAAGKLAVTDCIHSYAEAADRNNYCRPLFSNKKIMKLKELRHPVVEQLAFERFVPNDLLIDQQNYMLLITGPNMAGKSTYIRSAALAAIMAQSGSFVPAKQAELPLFDRVFARVGASDDLSSGHSTFMVEMKETAVILNEASADSLIILDEIGRGTSTYDGMSIARGVIEYISEQVKAKTLFSTHYHELTRLEGKQRGVKNYTMAVKEKGKDVIFLRQVIPGKADKSYGINVARLAGIPQEVLYRAEKILTELEINASAAAEHQLSLLPMVSERHANNEREMEVAEKLKNLDINRMTPLEALHKLFELQSSLLTEENDSDNLTEKES